MRLRRISTAAVLVAVSSGAFILSFPPHSLAWLPWFALVPLLLAIGLATNATSAAWLAALWGLLSAYGITAWLPTAIANYYEQPFLLGLGLFVSASVLMGSLQYALFGFVVRRLRRPSPFFVAAAWVAAELARCRLFGGNPWGLLGYTLVDPISSLPLATEPLLRLPVQVADLGGVYAASFVLVVWNAAVADVILGRWLRDRPTDGRRAPIANAVAAIVLVAAATAYGHHRIGQLTATAQSAAAVPVAVVQGNVSLGATWRAELYGRNFDVYQRGTHAVLDRAPALVVWPENSMSFFIEDEPGYRRAIGSLLAASGAQLLAGGPSHTASSPPQYFNSAYVFSSQGEILARYDKEKLLPFAEHFPFGAVAFLKRSFGKVREFTPGIRIAPLPTPAGPAGMLVCNEILYAEQSVARVRAGAGYLLNLSNDTWIGNDLYSQNHLAIGAIRAIETRRMLVRASTSGPSAFVDAGGRVTAVSAGDSEATLVAPVTASSVLTPYVRFGDLFAFLCVIAVALRVIVARRFKPVVTAPSSS